MKKEMFPVPYLSIVLMALIFASVLASCTGFFSTSLAPWAARDPASLVPPVDTGNVDELIRKSENNPGMSLEVLKKIKEAAKKAGPGEAGALQAAALKAASNASGMGSALLQQAGNISEFMNNTGSAIDMVTDTLNQMDNLLSAGENLAEIIPPPGTGEFDAFVEKADPNDLAIAAAILLASEAKKSGSGKDYLDSFHSGGALAPEETLAVQLAAAASKQGDKGLSGALKDILDSLHLTNAAPSPAAP
jgi:hypothetical protein